MVGTDGELGRIFQSHSLSIEVLAALSLPVVLHLVIAGMLGIPLVDDITGLLVGHDAVRLEGTSHIPSHFVCLRSLLVGVGSLQVEAVSRNMVGNILVGIALCLLVVVDVSRYLTFHPHEVVVTQVFS